MRKYILVAKSALKEQLQYLGNLFGGFFVYGIIVFVFLQLWMYIYQGSSSINGYSLNQLVWYIVITEFIVFAMNSPVISTEISNDIKSGKLAYFLNKPYHYLIFVLFKHIGTIIPAIISYIVFGAIMGIVYIGPLETFQIISTPFFLINLTLGGLIFALIYILIGLLSFWVEENAPFKWIFSKIIIVLGITFPLEFMPSWLRGFVKLSPVYTVTYAPAKMFVDFSFDEFFSLIMAQGIYIVVLIILIVIAYRKGVRRLNVNGG